MVKFGEWSDVDVEMPEDGDFSVFVAFSNGSVEDMKMVHVQDWVRDGGYNDLEITHWMPMPQHPLGL